MKSMVWLRRFIVFGLILMQVMTAITGCGEDDIPAPSETQAAEPIELWVVTEKTPDDGMNGQALTLIEEFEKNHENIKVRLDILPEEEDERAVRLDELRTQILAGKGPDAYLLPGSYGSRTERLFRDVAQSMYNGLFADISGYYDADDSLGKDALIPAVMDAGVAEGKRYILPLRYNLSLICGYTEALEGSGLDMTAIESGVLGLLDTVQAVGAQKWACGAEFQTQYYGFNVYPNLIDYGSGQVLLTAAEAAQFMEKYQANASLIGDAYEHRDFTDISLYIQDGKDWGSTEYPLTSLYSLDDMFDLAAVAKAEGKALTVLPLRATDGSLIADVTYWAAVGAGSAHPETAYEFIRQFLLEESQWEQNRVKLEITRHAMIASGWPVRAAGSVQPIWEHYRKWYQNTDYANPQAGWEDRKSAVVQLELTDGDIPLLQTRIDKARFPIGLERDYDALLYELNDYENGGAPTDVDINTLAEKVIQDLQWHVAEG